MSEVHIHDALVDAHFSGVDAVRAHRFSLKIPLSAIRSASVGIPAVALRETSLFRGNYHIGDILIGPEGGQEGHRETFYEVRHPERAVTLELAYGRFEYVVLEPTNVTPALLISQIEAATGRHLPAAHLPPGLMGEPRVSRSSIPGR